MKKGWEIKRLGDVLTIERGGSPRPIEKYLTDSPDGINWIKISDATASNKFIYETKEKIIKEGLHKTRMVNEGDFILSNSMSFGRPYIMKTSGCIHDGWLVLKQDNKKYFDVEFLYYLLSSPLVYNQFDSLAAGSTVRNLNIALVSTVNVPIPPLSEQKRIVATLDKAFAAIDQAIVNTEKNLQNVKELFESYLEGVFEDEKNNWHQYSLIDITTKIGSGATPRGGQESYKDSGISLVRSMNVHDLEFRDTNLAFIDEKQAKELDGVTLQENDVLLNITGASVARCCVFPKAYLPARVNQHVSIIRLKKDITDARFLNLLLCSRQYKNKLLETGEQGSTRQAITKVQIESFHVAIPDLKKQQAIVNQIDALISQTQKLKTLYQSKLTDLEELKKSILQKAFAGELNIDV